MQSRRGIYIYNLGQTLQGEILRFCPKYEWVAGRRFKFFAMMKTCLLDKFRDWSLQISSSSWKIDVWMSSFYLIQWIWICLLGVNFGNFKFLSLILLNGRENVLKILFSLINILFEFMSNENIFLLFFDKILLHCKDFFFDFEYKIYRICFKQSNLNFNLFHFHFRPPNFFPFYKGPTSASLHSSHTPILFIFPSPRPKCYR